MVVKFKYILWGLVFAIFLFILVGALKFFLMDRMPQKEINTYYENGVLLEDKADCSSWLNFFYNNAIGKLLRQGLNRSLVNYIVGIFQDSFLSKFLINYFIKKHNIDIATLEKPLEEYKTFNEFFVRKLKKGLRPIDKKSDFIAPADSRLLVYPNISLKNYFYTKQEKFNLEKFLGSRSLASKYENGTLCIFRLTPADYHWFHFPIDCYASELKSIKGYYESVDPIVYKSGFQPLTSNERKIIELRSEEFGDVMFVIVGAMMVGKIVTNYEPNKFYKKGDEIGYFKYGASTVAVLFEKGKINNIKKDFIKYSSDEYEVAVQMGVGILTY